MSVGGHFKTLCPNRLTDDHPLAQPERRGRIASINSSLGDMLYLTGF